MPYLNWKTAEDRPQGPYSQNIGAHPRREHELRLTLGREPLDELVSRLEEVFLEGGAELRVDLPEDWVLFWKNRDSESRLLIAHPQPTEWVATAALEPAHGAMLVAALRALQPGQAHPVSQGGSLGRISNVEILIALQG